MSDVPEAKDRIIEKINHATMDETVLGLLKSITGAQLPEEEDLPDDDLSELLFYIINTHRKTNGSSPKLQDCRIYQLLEFITNYPQIRDALQLAWREKSFREIRSSSVYIHAQSRQPATHYVLSQSFSAHSSCPLVMCPLICIHELTVLSSAPYCEGSVSSTGKYTYH